MNAFIARVHQEGGNQHIDQPQLFFDHPQQYLKAGNQNGDQDPHAGFSPTHWTPLFPETFRFFAFF